MCRALDTNILVYAEGNNCEWGHHERGWIFRILRGIDLSRLKTVVPTLRKEREGWGTLI
jgi:hypothetical protein